ncbi:MAG: hypothetical protein IKP98_01950 [Bacilli bacterium]|nr:hypothetical protein [Bacilli bacterium]
MKKKIVIPILIVCIIVILSILFLNTKIVYLGSHNKVITFGNKIFNYKSNKRILLRKAYIYKDGKALKGYIKSNKNGKTNEYYAVSKYNKMINVNNFIASGILKKLNIINIDDDIEIDSNKLKEYNELLDTNIELDNVYNYKEILFDIDNDSSEEKVIYIVYNENDSIFTSIIVDDNGNAFEIVYYEDNMDSDIQNKIYYLVNLIDFNNDKKYEVVVSVCDGDSQPTYYSIYKYDNGKVKEIK